MAMKKKGYAKGGAMKKKGYAKGGAMKKKPIAMKKGSKLRMVEKDGKKVPFFAADGVGKMKKGGVTKKKVGGAIAGPKTMKASQIKKATNKILKGKGIEGLTKKQSMQLMMKEIDKFFGDGSPKKKMGGGMMKKKGMAKGGAMKKKGYAKGGAVKKMGGGMMKKKGMAKGGAMKKQIGGKMKSKGRAKGGVARGSGAARPQKFTRNG